MILTDRYSEALTYAERLHRAQTRKGTDVPYVAHLLAVCATVLEWGGDEDTAIAALLHDAVEDQGGLDTLAVIEDRFGPRVAGIVSACTDSVATDRAEKAPWLERKRAHLAKLSRATSEVALVTAADKLHNAQATIRNIRHRGLGTLSRFNASPEQMLWYFARVCQVLKEHRATAPIEELEQEVATLARLLGRPVPELDVSSEP
ncbi:MAG: HD domain-containing protein [Verrucomicrobia bacterium]|nr:HD domain-containing protein [Verrucomicrobiota bacterium]